MKSTLRNILLGSLLITFSQSVNSQCTVSIETASDTLDCGDCFDLEAVGLSEQVLLDEDFNNSALGPGWSANQTVMFNNPCGAPPDGSPTAWFGNQQGDPRYVETIDYDVTCGGDICFMMMYASQGGGGSCEGPDLVDEGVSLEYSLDGGVTWVLIHDHVVLNNGTDPLQTTWQEYCHAIPPAAQTASTRFRWNQYAASSALNDHWGIDDVKITAQLCNQNYYYDWNVDGISNSPDTTDCIENNEQDYTVIFTDGISDTCSATITMYSALSPNLTPEDTLICGLTDLDLLTNPTGGTANYEYEWSTGETSSEIEVDTTNTYWVEITDLNYPGCVARDSSLIEIYPNPVPDFSAYPLCQGAVTEFTDETSLPSWSEVAEWDWDFDNNNATSSQQNPSHTFSGVGSYNVNLSVETDFGCSVDTTIKVTIEPSPFANFDFDNVCAKEEIEFTNESIGDYVEMEWNFGDSNDTLDDVENPIYEYEFGGTYDVSLIITDTSGLCKDTSIKAVQIYDLPDMDLIADPNQGEPPLPVDFYNLSTGAVDYIWDFGNGNIENNNDDTLFQEYPEVGTYEVILTGISDKGCENTFTETIIVDYPLLEVEIPNVFTPNNDGSNDAFYINYNDAIETITEFEIVILNRWGNVLKTSSDPEFEWDGTNPSGKEAGDGTYFYKVNIKTIKDQDIEEHGFVQLVRN
ncbi:MAG: PKD domain-containing protein [Brumimicrobium sp.]